MSDQKTMRRLYLAGVLLSASILVAGSFAPFQFVPTNWSDALEIIRGKVSAPWHASGGRSDWSINYLITIPLAFFGMGALLADRSNIGRSILAALLVSIAVGVASVMVEVGQIWVVGRVPSPRDVIAQWSGTLTGVTLWWLVGTRFTVWFRKLAALPAPRERIDWVLQAYVLGLFVYSLLPFNFVTSARELLEKYRSGQFELIPFTIRQPSVWASAYAYGTGVIVFVPVGMWAVSAFRRSEQPARGRISSLALGVVIAISIEVMQVVVLDRYTSSTDVILATVGIGVGVLGMYQMRRDGDHNNAERWPLRCRWASASLVAAIVYSAAIAAVFWAPYDFTNDTRLIKERVEDFWSIPFARLQAGSDIQALFATIRKSLWFLPLGAFVGLSIAWAPVTDTVRAWLYLAGCAAILAIATCVELGQVLQPNKFADASDILICGAGAIAALFFVTKCLKPQPARPISGDSCLGANRR